MPSGQPLPYCNGHNFYNGYYRVTHFIEQYSTKDGQWLCSHRSIANQCASSSQRGSCEICMSNLCWCYGGRQTLACWAALEMDPWREWVGPSFRWYSLLFRTNDQSAAVEWAPRRARCRTGRALTTEIFFQLKNRMKLEPARSKCETDWVAVAERAWTFWIH